MRYDTELALLADAVKTAYREQTRDAVEAEAKGSFDVVTRVDLAIERALIEVLRAHFPADRILSEETRADTRVEGRTWTIDPIDGTYNLTRQIPMYGVQMALYDGGEIGCSLLYLPREDALYTAQRGEGAFLDGRRLRVSPHPLDCAVVSFGDFPHARPADAARQHELMRKLSPRIARIRMFGAACVDFISVATGRTDGTVLFTQNKWDLAPGMLLAQEAGAQIHSLTGEYSALSEAIVVTNTDALYDCIRN